MFFSSIMEVHGSIRKIDMLISKGISSIYYWEKLTFSKLQFSRKENLKKCTSFEEQKGTSHIWGNVFFFMSSAVFVHKTMSQISFNLICSGDKRLLWGWFHWHNELFPKYLG